jgi:hypothetical protein
MKKWSRIVKKEEVQHVSLTPNQVRAIRSSGRSASTLATQFNVSEKEIRDIQTMKTHTLI